jgi:hypothetical protein
VAKVLSGAAECAWARRALPAAWRVWCDRAEEERAAGQRGEQLTDLTTGCGGGAPAGEAVAGSGAADEAAEMASLSRLSEAARVETELFLALMAKWRSLEGGTADWNVHAM